MFAETAKDGDQPRAAWFKARRCSGGNCVEVRFDADHVLIRDSKQNGQAAQAIIRVTKPEWAGFLDRVSGRATSCDAIIIDERDDGVVLRAGAVALSYDMAEWDRFCAGVREGDLTPEPAIA